MDRARILVSGAGIAGLTLAVELKRQGFNPLVIEREPTLRREGYMMDFAGTGWDVAERMGLTDRLRAASNYPIDAMEFVDAHGEPYVHMPIDRLRRAHDRRYVYLRRQDLERILFERARDAGVDIRFGASLAHLDDRGDGVDRHAWERRHVGTLSRLSLAARTVCIRACASSSSARPRNFLAHSSV